MTYSRRNFLSLAALSAFVVVLPGCATLDAANLALRNRVSLSESQLQQYVDRRYPRKYEPFGGIVVLSIMNPILALPKDGNRLHLDFDVGIDGLGMHSDAPAGHFAITSGLRYDTGSHALYLEAPALETAELPVIGERMNSTGRDLIDDWLREYARSEPVYRLDEDALRALGSRRIAGTLIQNGQVVIKLDR